MVMNNASTSIMATETRSEESGWEVEVEHQSCPLDLSDCFVSEPSMQRQHPNM